MSQEPSGRLAFRVEGDQWVVYYAQTDTMVDAIRLASVEMRLVRDAKLKRLFMEFCKEALAEMFQSEGVNVERWDESTAPEHERQPR